MHLNSKKLYLEGAARNIGLRVRFAMTVDTAAAQHEIQRARFLSVDGALMQSTAQGVAQVLNKEEGELITKLCSDLHI